MENMIEGIQVIIDELENRYKIYNKLIKDERKELAESIHKDIEAIESTLKMCFNIRVTYLTEWISPVVKYIEIIDDYTSNVIEKIVF